MDDTLMRFRKDNDALKASLRMLMEEQKTDRAHTKQTISPVKPTRKFGTNSEKFNKVDDDTFFNSFKSNVNTIKSAQYELPKRHDVPKVEQREPKPVKRDNRDTLLIDKLTRQNEIIEALESKLRQVQIDNRQLTNENSGLRQKLTIERQRQEQKIEEIEQIEPIHDQKIEPVHDLDSDLQRKLDRYADKIISLKQTNEELIKTQHQQKQQLEKKDDIIHTLRKGITVYKHKSQDLETKLADTKSVNWYLRNQLDKYDQTHQKEYNTTSFNHSPDTMDLINFTAANTEDAFAEELTTEMLIRGSHPPEETKPKDMSTYSTNDNWKALRNIVIFIHRLNMRTEEKQKYRHQLQQLNQDH